jgi:phosphohistidine swiveling domain-containing protein
MWRKLFVRKNCDIPTCCGIISTAYGEIWNITKDKKEYLFGVLRDKHYHYYVQGVDEQDIGRRLYQRFYGKPSDVIRKYQEGKKFLQQTHKKIEHYKLLLKKANSKSVLTEALKEFTQDFKYVNFNFSISPWWALEAWQHDFEKIIGGLITQRGLSGRYDEIIYHLLKPWKLTALRQISRDLSQGMSVKNLVRKYQFLRSWTVIWNKPITSEYIKSAKEENDQFFKSTRRQIISLLKPNKVQRKFIDMAPYIIFFKDWRDDLRRQQAYAWAFLFEHTAKILNISILDLGYLTLKEMISALNRGCADKELINNRKEQGVLLKPSVKTHQINFLPISGNYLKYIHQAETVGAQQAVKGICAQPGRVQGRARIINSYHDLKKVENGEIFIASTTHPDYLIGMKKAAAFVTNEGGVISHAAIVSRELKIPCVVGTKIATKVFKDGDLVEVDAERGIVKKIK